MPAMEAVEASRPLLKRAEILEATFEDAMMYAVDAYCVAGSYKKCPRYWPSVEDCENCWRRHFMASRRLGSMRLVRSQPRYCSVWS